MPGRPESFSALYGQSATVDALRAWLAEIRNTRDSAALLFSGATGVGKTSAAWIIARELGCDVDEGELGGLYEIASGEQDGRAVRALLASLRLRPLVGSGWRVAIVNEADHITRQAEISWLDGLEALPPQSVVIFTTNDPAALSERLRSRTEEYAFRSAGRGMYNAVATAVRAAWQAKHGEPLSAVPDWLGLADPATGRYSFRLALQQLAPYLRSGEAPPRRRDAPEGTAPDRQSSEAGRDQAAQDWERVVSFARGAIGKVRRRAV